jgi:diaminopimelate epimerase
LVLFFRKEQSSFLMIPFRKMHGTGNDFVVVDARGAGLAISPSRIAALADRRRGIGCDQFITLEPAEGADVFMRIHNPDGSESGACGNATRCVAALLHEETGRRAFVIRTLAGDLPAVVGADVVSVDMGPPRLAWQDVPLAEAVDTLHLPIAGDPAALSMGNPHVTFFAENVADVSRGAELERHALFPQGANIGFAQLLARDRIRLRVWERGAGLTLACGSGACAALVNACRRGLAGRAAELVLDGGVLHIAWRADGHVIMTGPAETAFHGTVDISTYPA